MCICGGGSNEKTLKDLEPDLKKGIGFPGSSPYGIRLEKRRDINPHMLLPVVFSQFLSEFGGSKLKTWHGAQMDTLQQSSDECAFHFCLIYLYSWCLGFP